MNVDIKNKGDRYVVVVPEEVANSFYSFERILSIFDNLRDLENKEIIFSFIKTRWFDANLCSIFGALFIILIQNNNSVKIHKMSTSVKSILEKNKFLSAFGLNSQPDVYNTTIDFKKFNQENKTEFQKYINHNLLPKLKIDMSEEFKSILASNLDEIYQNARTHGDSSKILACGQWYPTRKIVKFTICDIGVTIPENIKEIKPTLSAAECINYATDYGTSTKPSDQSGGLGLYNLKSFIEYNKGKMHIISGNGYWGMAKDISIIELDSHFNGTIVNLEINLNDENIYYCMNELGNLNNMEKDCVISDLF